MSKWFTSAATSGIGNVNVFDDIGSGGVTIKDFSQALKALGNIRTLHIGISSNGGDVHQGFAIYNTLKAHPARKIVTITGLAASMASVIAMAGDEVIMPSNSMLMIHNPWGSVMGGGEQIASFGEALLKMRDDIADAYVKRTGLSVENVLAMMDRETWLSAEEAVKLGFADRVVASIDMAASIDVLKLSKFKNVPRSMFGGGRTERPHSLDSLATRAFKKFNSAAATRQAEPEAVCNDGEYD